jgi:5-methylcytosine-specific restriction endonuclease McrA
MNIVLSLESYLVILNILTSKPCSKCEQIKPLKEFYKDRGKYRSECNCCTRHRISQKLNENRDAINLQRRTRRQSNPVPVRTRERLWRSKQDKDILRNRLQSWYDKNPSYKSTYNQQYYQEHKTQFRIAGERWRLAHLDTHQNRGRRYHARKKRVAISDLTTKQWQMIKESYGFRCVYCGNKPVRLTQDHVVPISKGGNHTASNVVPACRPCNSKKRDLPAPRFQPILPFYDASAAD